MSTVMFLLFQINLFLFFLKVLQYYSYFYIILIYVNTNEREGEVVGELQCKETRVIVRGWGWRKITMGQGDGR
jgi:hypothetical protein